MPKNLNQLKAKAELQEFCRQPRIDYEMTKLWNAVMADAAETGDVGAVMEAGLADPKTRQAFTLLGIWLQLDDDGSLQSFRF
jgi:hypothetical protein